MNLKKKFSAVVNHVKSNPIPYTILATGLACAVIEVIYYKNKNLVDLDKAAAQMNESGLGLYFKRHEDNEIILMKLAKHLTEAPILD